MHLLFSELACQQCKEDVRELAMTWWDKAWDDPVGSKLIAETIKALAAPAFGMLAAVFIAILTRPPWFVATYNIPVWALGILVVVFYFLILALIGAIIWKRKRVQSLPAANVEIRKIEVLATDPAQGSVLTFPVKCNLTLLNDSQIPIDVRVLGFEPGAVTLKENKVNTLVLQFHGSWWPSNNSVERVAVFPGQQFRAWIAVDDTREFPTKETDVGHKSASYGAVQPCIHLIA